MPRPASLTVERQTMADTTPPVTVQAPSGATETVTLKSVEPGLWRATVPVKEIGLYRVEQGDKRAFAHVGAANPKEFIDARSTPDLLAPLVKQTGGHIGRMADAGGHVEMPRIVPVRSGSTMSGSDWMGIRMTEASVLKGVGRLPLFSGLARPRPAAGHPRGNLVPRRTLSNSRKSGDHFSIRNREEKDEIERISDTTER